MKIPIVGTNIQWCKNSITKLNPFFVPGISDAMKQVFALYEANYPENLHSSYVINGELTVTVSLRQEH